MALTPPLAPVPDAPAAVHHETCRACLGRLSTVLDLGIHQLNHFPETPDGVLGPAVPLVLAVCSRCHLFQLKDTAPRELLYGQYWYRSGVSETMRANLSDVATKALGTVHVRGADTVIDIGANDGTLLGFFQERCVARRVAVEPALNLHDDLKRNARPDQILEGFFPDVQYTGPQAKVVTSIAMFYDLENPHLFVDEIRRILAPDGIWILEVGYFPWMLERGVFDVVCHEHLEYYSFEAIVDLLQQHHLKPVDVELNWSNGRSLRVYAMREESPPPNVVRLQGADDRIRKLLLDERGTITPERIDLFRRKAESLKQRIRDSVYEALSLGWTVDLYGASTKGNTLLQYCELGYREIRRAIERSPDKINRYTVGSGIPIVTEWTGRDRPAELWLCPIWQFKDQVLERESRYLENGGRILFPLPEPEIVFWKPQATNATNATNVTNAGGKDATADDQEA